MRDRALYSKDHPIDICRHHASLQSISVKLDSIHHLYTQHFPLNKLTCWAQQVSSAKSLLIEIEKCQRHCSTNQDVQKCTKKVKLTQFEHIFELTVLSYVVSSLKGVKSICLKHLTHLQHELKYLLFSSTKKWSLLKEQLLIAQTEINFFFDFSREQKDSCIN